MKSGSRNETAVPSDWEHWLDQHTRAFLLFARQQTRCEPDAQDLVQEAIVESWRRQANGTPPSPALVFATIRRRAIDLARSTGRRTEREQVVSLEPQPCWFEPDIEDRERHRLLHDAMQQLPEIYRSVLTLKIWAGLTFAEIAIALNIPANTAASRYRYGLIELRKLSAEVLA